MKKLLLAIALVFALTSCSSHNKPSVPQNPQVTPQKDETQPKNEETQPKNEETQPAPEEVKKTQKEYNLMKVVPYGFAQACEECNNGYTTREVCGKYYNPACEGK